jgi:hypothetical protein
MSIARNLARRLFGQSIEVIGLELVFHKKANLYGTHGIITASHRDQKLDNYPVRFCFVGLSEAPPMTPVIMNYIWEEAKAQGYTPFKLQSYGHVLETTPSMDKHVPQIGAVPEAISAIAQVEAAAAMHRAQGHTIAPTVRAEVDDMVGGIIPQPQSTGAWRPRPKDEKADTACRELGYVEKRDLLAKTGSLNSAIPTSPDVAVPPAPQYQSRMAPPEVATPAA